MNNICVRIVYRDENLNPVYSKTYSLEDYTSMLRASLLRVITDVEDVMYIANGNKNKNEWTEESRDMFYKIKHKILDDAGDIGRLPENIVELKPLAECIEEIIDRKG